MSGERLDKYVSEKENITRSAAQKLIEGGYVKVNGEVKNKNYKLSESDEVETEFPKETNEKPCPEDIPIKIIYEDESLMVVYKPKGMVVHPGAGNNENTLVNALLFHCGSELSDINGEERPGIVHRIDKDTEGLLLVAKNNEVHLSLANQIKEHKADRIYRALLVGNLKEDEGVINKNIARHPFDRKKMACVEEGREAVTHFKVLKRFKGFTYAEMHLETGRTHQIRVHMASIGHAVAGDKIYGAGNTPFEKHNAKLFDGQCLFAKSIGFVHPITKEYNFFDSEMPVWFSEILSKLEKITESESF